MKLYYIWDAYCGWCHGFKAILKPFVENHKDIAIEVLSGGLFDKGNTIGQYTHIPNANAQIQQIYNVQFGPKYQELLQKGDLIMHSYHPAVAFSILREHVSNDKQVLLAATIQEMFYHQGYSLSDVETYRGILESFNIDEKVFESITTALETTYDVHPDYEKVRQLGTTSYPTLLLEHNGYYTNIRGNAMSVENLEFNYQIAKVELLKIAEKEAE